jgi:hypothetical protein
VWFQKALTEMDMLVDDEDMYPYSSMCRLDIAVNTEFFALILDLNLLFVVRCLSRLPYLLSYLPTPVFNTQNIAVLSYYAMLGALDYF